MYQQRRKVKMALEAAERETVITMSDADDFIHVQTSQRKWITKIEKNAAAEILEDFTFEKTRFITAKLPINALINFRNVAGQRDVPAKRQMKAAKCSATAASGKPCGRIARKDTGKCPAHS